MSPTIDTNINGVLSWMTAAWILRLCDEPLRVTTLQPGDGQYDALALLRGSAAPAILMNRSGASALVEGRVVEDIWEVASGRSGTGPRELALLLLSESGIAADLAEIPDTYALSIAQIATAMNFYREVNKRPRRVDCREIPADALTSWVDPPLPPDLANAASEHPAVIDGQREGSWIWQLLREGDVIAYCDTFTNTCIMSPLRKFNRHPYTRMSTAYPLPPWLRHWLATEQVRQRLLSPWHSHLECDGTGVLTGKDPSSHCLRFRRSGIGLSNEKTSPKRNCGTIWIEPRGRCVRSRPRLCADETWCCDFYVGSECCELPTLDSSHSGLTRLKN